MVLEAAMEEEYGSDYDRSSNDTNYQMVAGQGVWEWLTDSSATVEAGEELSRQAIATVRRSRIELPSEAEVMSGFSTIKVDELDDQTRDLLELIAGEEITEGELKSVDLSLETSDQIPESEGLSPADEARLATLASTPVLTLDIGGALSPLNVEMMNPLDTSETVSKESLDEYLSALKAAASATGSMSADEVKSLFSAEGEVVEVDNEPEAENDPEIKSLMALTEDKIPESFDLDLSEVREQYKYDQVPNTKLTLTSYLSTKSGGWTLDHC